MATTGVYMKSPFSPAAPEKLHNRLGLIEFRIFIKAGKCIFIDALSGFVQRAAVGLMDKSIGIFIHPTYFCGLVDARVSDLYRRFM